MICLPNHRPAIQVAHHQVFDYDGLWLADALHQAANAAQQQDFPYINEIVIGVLQYLDTHYPSNLVPIEALYQRVKKMLHHIGCHTIADHLQLQAPPLTFSLLHTIQRSDFPAELGFLQQLKTDLHALHLAGAHHITFTHHRETILTLLGHKKWNKTCQAFSLLLHALLQQHLHPQQAA